MLAETFSALTELLEDAGEAQRVHIELFCFDFCNLAAWQICNLRKGAKRLVFVMGGTVGNVREDQFIEAMGSVLDADTVLAIGSSFYESLEELEQNGERDINEQYGHAANELVIGSVAKSIQDNYRHMKLQDLIGRVHKKFLPAEAGPGFPAIMASRIPGTHAALFSFSLSSNEPIRLSRRPTVRRLHLAVSRRYVKSEFKAFVERALNVATVYVDNPNNRRFAYLIARSKPEHSS
jgi:hypothetical protein